MPNPEEVEPLTEEQIAEQKEFDAAFDEEENGQANEGNPKENKPASQESKPAEDVQAAEQKAAASPEEKTPAADPAAQKTVPTGEQSDEYKALYEKELQRTKSWEGRITAANQKAKEAEERIALLEQELTALRNVDDAGEEPATGQKEGEDPTAGDEELQEFSKEFPDIAKPVEKLVKKAVGKVEKTLKKKEDEDAKEAYDAMVKEHFDKIGEAHPDFRDVFGDQKITEWIDSKPPHIAVGLRVVVKQGTADEVIAMLDNFKEETAEGEKDPEGESPDPKTPADSKKKELEKMVAVDPSSTTPKTTAGVNKNDFDSAWDEAPEEEFKYQ